MIAFTRLLAFSKFGEWSEYKYYIKPLVHHFLLLTKECKDNYKLSLICIRTILHVLDEQDKEEFRQEILAFLVYVCTKHSNYYYIKEGSESFINSLKSLSQSKTEDKEKVMHFQFLFLNGIENLKHFKITSVVKKLKLFVYSSETDRRKSLEILAQDIATSDDMTVLNLNLRYLLEIIEDKNNSLNKIIFEKDFGQRFFSNVFSIKNKTIYQQNNLDTTQSK